MPHVRPPELVRELAARRSSARGARDWPLADALKAEIEAAGWRVIDQGTNWRLESAAPPDVDDGPAPLYGSWRSVPSRLDADPDAAFTVHLLAENDPTDLARTLAALRRHAPSGSQVLVTANAPSPDQAERLEPGSSDLEPIGGRPVEVVRTSAHLGHAAALNVGLRRSSAEIIVLAGTSIEPTGDALTPLAGALADPGVAVAGAVGSIARDISHFEDSDGPVVDAIDGRWLAFRRSDFAALGPLDERFVSGQYLDAWWSLVLRGGHEGAARTAVRVDLPLIRHAPVRVGSLDERPGDREAKRNLYRLLDRFGSRRDLLGGVRPPVEVR